MSITWQFAPYSRKDFKKYLSSVFSFTATLTIFRGFSWYIYPMLKSLNGYLILISFLFCPDYAFSLIILNIRWSLE